MFKKIFLDFGGKYGWNFGKNLIQSNYVKQYEYKLVHKSMTKFYRLNKNSLPEFTQIVVNEEGIASPNYYNQPIEEISPLKKGDWFKNIKNVDKQTIDQTLEETFGITSKDLASKNYWEILQKFSKKSATTAVDLALESMFGNDDITVENIQKICSEKEWQQMLDTTVDVYNQLNKISQESKTTWQAVVRSAAHLANNKDFAALISLLLILASILKTLIEKDAERDTIEKQIKRSQESIDESKLEIAELSVDLLNKQQEIDELPQRKMQLGFLVDNLLKEINTLKEQQIECSESEAKEIDTKIKAIRETMSLYINMTIAIDQIVLELPNEKELIMGKLQQSQDILQKKYRDFDTLEQLKKEEDFERFKE